MRSSTTRVPELAAGARVFGAKNSSRQSHWDPRDNNSVAKSFLLSRHATIQKFFKYLDIPAFQQKMETYICLSSHLLRFDIHGKPGKINSQCLGISSFFKHIERVFNPISTESELEKRRSQVTSD